MLIINQTAKEINLEITQCKQEITNFKNEIESLEPNLNEIATYIEEHHPNKITQRLVECDMRNAQIQLDDLRDALRKTQRL